MRPVFLLLSCAVLLVNSCSSSRPVVRERDASPHNAMLPTRKSVYLEIVRINRYAHLRNFALEDSVPSTISVATFNVIKSSVRGPSCIDIAFPVAPDSPLPEPYDQADRVLQCDVDYELFLKARSSGMDPDDSRLVYYGAFESVSIRLDHGLNQPPLPTSGQCPPSNLYPLPGAADL
jgi:hypothetical protein